MNPSRVFPIALLTLVASLTSCGGGGGGGSQPPPSGGPNPPSNPPPSGPQVTVTYPHVFQAGTGDAGTPIGPLVQASDGNLFGTAAIGVNQCDGGNSTPCGAIFKLTLAGAESLLYSFGPSVNLGYRPSGPLMQGSDGALYGLTANGGDTGAGGTIFKITLAGDYTQLHSFGSTPGGGIVPLGRLIQASDGNFYGVTASGGANHSNLIPQGGGNCGTVFKMTQAGDVTTMYSFGSSPADAVLPNSGLVQASDGNFYGTTQLGGTNSCSLVGAPNSCGTVYKMTPAGAVTVVYSFGVGFDPSFLPTDGIAPLGTLIQGRDGALYGTTASGGSGRCGTNFGCGTVFRLTLGGELTILHAFAVNSLEDGYGPSQYLVQGTDGFLYGTTGSGGINLSSLEGTAFRVSTTGSKTTLFSFGPSSSKPTNPTGGLIQASDGAFYGVNTYSSGVSGAGAIFKMILQ